MIDNYEAPLRAGLGEFYFETARAISSLTANRTILKYPNLHWRISHGAGAFPDIQDRFLLGFPDIVEEARKVYASRFWYDSAGPVYPTQIKGLLAHGVPVSQMVFGTVSAMLLEKDVFCRGGGGKVPVLTWTKDYPYGIGFWNVNANIAGLTDADYFTDKDKEMIFHGNAEKLWKGKM